MDDKTIILLINDDGTVEMDQVGWGDKSCSGEIQDLINAIGNEKKVTKKQEYYRDNEVHIHQEW